VIVVTGGDPGGGVTVVALRPPITEFAAIRSYTATTRKHGINLYDALTQLTQGKPWLPGTT
jgi:hypothetical protein